ncbi:MAG: hypothetical protein WA259_09470, partial [Mycobacterium sp.]
PPAQDLPSSAGTTRIPTPGRAEHKEPPTTRFSAQQTASPTPAPGRERPPAPGPQQSTPNSEDREIESWLSELRGTQPGDRPADPRGPAPVPPSQPSADQTRAMPIPREQPAAQPPTEPEDATTAIPTAPRQDMDPETATEKVNARGENGENPEPPRQRRGGGLSAQDLLRREGRI